MKLKLLVMTILTVSSLLLGQENQTNYQLEQNNQIYYQQQPKSISAGVGLGAIGCIGASCLIPGAFGWGNFYANDKNGWLIINIAGSTCTIFIWAEVFRLMAKYPDGNFSSEDISLLAYIGAYGSMIAAIVSTISGGLSVYDHNTKLEMNKQKFSFYLIPQKDKVNLCFNYKF